MRLLNLPLLLCCILLQSCTSYSGKEISPGWYWAEQFLGEIYEYGRCVEGPFGGQSARCTASNVSMRVSLVLVTGGISAVGQG